LITKATILHQKPKQASLEKDLKKKEDNINKTEISIDREAAHKWPS